MAAAAALQSALEPWGLGFTAEGVAAFEHAEAGSSAAAAKAYVLHADLRRLHLAPHAADAANFSALLSKSMQAAPEVAAWAAVSEEPLEAAGSPAAAYCLKKPLLCMVLSFQDVRLPTKDVEEDFSGGAQGIKGNRKRLLLLKLTDGRGSSFSAVELRFCSQLDACPLLPGVKLLLLPGVVLYRGIALLSPDRLQNLGGEAAQLREAFALKAEVEERRKLVQQIVKENSQLQQRLKEDKADGGPPKFVPFSFSAQVQQVEIERPSPPPKPKQSSQTQPPRETLKREAEGPAQQPTGGGPREEGPREGGPRSAALLGGVNPGDLKHERLRQLEKAAIASSVGADKVSPLESSRGRGRGGRGRRERRERDEDLGEYLKPTGRPVTYTLFDLIKADAQQTNSSAATALLCASEAYVADSAAPATDPQLSPAAAASPLEGPRRRGLARGPPRSAAATALRRPPEEGSGRTDRGRRGGGPGRGGRGRVEELRPSAHQRLTVVSSAACRVEDSVNCLTA
ncbi:hypothetical protein Efla_005792 [Eimeria flavescens]